MPSICWIHMAMEKMMFVLIYIGFCIEMLKVFSFFFLFSLLPLLPILFLSLFTFSVATAMVVHGVDSHPPMEMTQPLTGTLSEQKTEPNPQKQQLRRRKNFSLSESEEEKGRREREGESGGESSSGRSDSMSDLGDVEMKVVNGSQKGISYWDL